ncbi:Uncharacterized protein NEOC65_000981 [Neochlamydia sp. AcF65]|nr:Uncharacterized protein [Neochlamydia sp. AcF65]NGY96095.1 hypothetical protein [Neochlamydia sp. AcF84]
MSELKDGVNLKIFIGCLITSELRMHLNQSLLWKQNKIVPALNSALREIHFKDKDYIGIYSTTDKISLMDLKKIEKEILQLLATYCPLLLTEKIQTLIFSQVFIS